MLVLNGKHSTWCPFHVPQKSQSVMKYLMDSIEEELGSKLPIAPCYSEAWMWLSEQGRLNCLSPERKSLLECSGPREEQDLDMHYLLGFAVACLHVLTTEQQIGLHLGASTSMHELYGQSDRCWGCYKVTRNKAVNLKHTFWHQKHSLLHFESLSILCPFSRFSQLQ